MFDGDLAVKIEKTSLVPSLFSSERQWMERDTQLHRANNNEEFVETGEKREEEGIGVKGKRAFFDARSLMLSRVSSSSSLFLARIVL